jgi:CheY-like chemotaxis protein
LVGLRGFGSLALNSEHNGAKNAVTVSDLGEKVQVTLHIEDDDASAYLLKYALLEAGRPVAVFRVADGEAGISFLKQHGEYKSAPKPDLVIVDLNLPKISGHEVLEVMQRDPALKSIPSVVLTTSGYEGDRQKANKAGTRKYIVKPMNIGELMSEVNAICDEFLPPKGSEMHGEELD